MKKQIMSVFFILVTCLILCVPTFAADNVSVRENYLTAEKIRDGYYVYRDETGAVVATREDLDQVDFASQTRAAVWPIDWSLQNGSCKHDSIEIDPTENPIEVYVSINFSRTGKSRMGWYDTRHQAYTWMSDYVADGFHSKITMMTSNKVNLAIENCSERGIRYYGKYSLAPF